MGISQPARVRLCDIQPCNGVADVSYSKAVEELSASLMKHNAVVIELGSEDRALMKCGLESVKMHFRSSDGVGGLNWGKGRGCAYMYRAGRSVEDGELQPPCMAEIFNCMGKAARNSLSAIARHLRLRTDVFSQLLDDAPLRANETSSSVLVASYSSQTLQNGKGGVLNAETEKGLLTMIASDAASIQVCDPNGHWYLADIGSSPGDLLLLTGRALSHVTAGLRPAASFRTSPDSSRSSTTVGSTTLSFRLMPQNSAVLDCSPIAAAGHVIPHRFVPVPVSQFMDDLISEEHFSTLQVNNSVAGNNFNAEASLRSVVTDPLSGTYLDDAMLVSCGHSFGGAMLRRVIEMSRCTLCNTEIESSTLVPNLAVRAAAAFLKQEEWRSSHNTSQRKRKKQPWDLLHDSCDPDRQEASAILSTLVEPCVHVFFFCMKLITFRFLTTCFLVDIQENGDADDALYRSGQYPFSVNEKVVIQGNKRTPDKFVGKEAIITSHSLNGWYVLKIIESGESVRLQYRSLCKLPTSSNADKLQTLPTNNN